MSRRSGVLFLLFGAVVVLAALGASTLGPAPETADPPEPPVVTAPKQRDEVAALRARIADLERQLRVATALSAARTEPPKEALPPPTVAETLDRARGLSNSKANTGERLRLFRDVLERSSHPNDRALAHYGVAMTCSVLGRKLERVYELERAVQTGADHPIRTSAAYYLSFERHARGDVRGALELIEEFLDDPRHHPSMVRTAKDRRSEWIKALDAAGSAR